MKDTHNKKNRDYTGGNRANPLGNFRRVATIMRLYPGFNWASEFGVSIAGLLKQLDAALTMYATGHQSVTGEGVPRRLRDVQVYGVLAEINYKEHEAWAEAATPMETQKS